jgi:predicted phosphodiesterase
LRGLQRYEGAPVAEIRGATRRALENLVDLALTENVAFVLLAGDLYDGDWRDYNTGLFFTGQMARLREYAVQVFVIAGNHDAASQITRVLRPPDNVHIFSTSVPETVILDRCGVAVHGQGFATRSVTEDLSLGYPAAHSHLFNIGMLHTSLDGRPGHEPYAPCSVAGLRSKGYQYWALGHVHKREVVEKEPWIVFPGNTQGRHARESGVKGCTLVTVQDGQVLRLEHRPLDVVRWVCCDVDLSGAADLDAVLGRAGVALDEALVAAEGRLVAARLRLSGACEANATLRSSGDRLVNECRGLANTLGFGDLWVEKVQVSTRRAESQEAALARDDAFGGLLRAVKDLELDEARLSAVASELADLRSKLPPELLDGAEPFDPTHPNVLCDGLEDVKELLLEQLLSHTAPE